MIPVDDAIRILADAAEPREVVEAPLAQARGLALGEEIVADRDFPPTDRSAMDGYAVRAADVRGAEARLRLVGEVPAGTAAVGLAVGPSEAARVFTGAVVPAGADAVVMLEGASEEAAGRLVRVEGPVEPGENVRHRASDRCRGATIVEAGTPIHAPEVAALASVGRVRIRVHRPPVVQVVSTGDELVPPRETPLPHQIRESNGVMLVALLGEMGVAARILGRVEDRPEALARTLGDGLGADLLLVTGGMSVGAYDLVARTLAEAGAATLFHGVAMRPGKPVLAARRGSTVAVGLPGNPVSALVGFAVLVAPALRRMLGYRRWATPEIEAVLAAPLSQRPGRESFYLARIAWRGGRLEAERVAATGSGDVLALSRANGLLRVAATASRLEAGERVRALLWRDSEFR